jgi:hypothetical protein
MRACKAFVSLSLLVLAVGCGGGQESAEEPPPAESTAGTSTAGTSTAGTSTAGTSTAGAEAPPPEPEPAPVAEPEPEPPSGPGQIRVTNVVRGEEVGGTVQVLSADGEVVAEGSSGDTFTVDSGQYRVQGAITDDSILIDTPSHALDGAVTVSPGETATARIDFPVSRVRIEVRRGGRSVARWRLTVTRQGPEPGEEIVLEPSEEHVAITPGRYDGTLRFGGQQIEVSGLIFQGGATQTVPVNVN